jgi:hypothetical protein
MFAGCRWRCRGLATARARFGVMITLMVHLSSAARLVAQVVDDTAKSSVVEIMTCAYVAKVLGNGKNQTLLRRAATKTSRNR